MAVVRIAIPLKYSILKIFVMKLQLHIFHEA